MQIGFHKMHGLGTDFVVIDGRERAIAIDPATARALADRRTGVGCDQVIMIGRSAVADVSMRIWNADGSEVAACGNATRCIPMLLERDCSIETGAGLLHATLEEGGAVVDMGRPKFDWPSIPLAYAMDTGALPLAWDELERPAAVNVGNPHLVFFVPDVAAVPLDELGPRIESDPMFPERINVNIAQIVDRHHIRARTWERGAGLTRACGTGACATAVAAIIAGRTERPVQVELPGGTLTIGWTPGGTITMAGPATHVFSGEIDLPVAA
jgi:diaminopimelate epimerase